MCNICSPFYSNLGMSGDSLDQKIAGVSRTCANWTWPSWPLIPCWSPKITLHALTWTKKEHECKENQSDATNTFSIRYVQESHAVQTLKSFWKVKIISKQSQTTETIIKVKQHYVAEVLGPFPSNQIYYLHIIAHELNIALHLEAILSI